MDISSLVGIIAAWVLVIMAMMLGVGVGAYIDAPSALIVIGGSLGALMIGHKMDQIKVLGALFGAVFKPNEIDLQVLIKKLVDFAMQARRDGILSLEAAASGEDNEFLKKGLMMAVDGNEPDTVRELLEIEIEQMSARHKIHGGLFGKWGGFAGAYGLIGTLVGLVAMLVNMSDPAAIGPSMAVALLTTMYGAMIANMITAPMEAKLQIRSGDEAMAMTIMVEGIMSIQAGDNPRVLEQKLMAFVAPGGRVSQFD